MQNVPPANHSVSVKLPEIKIPEFGGKSDEWIEFRDLFKSLEHSNNQKLHYLRSALKGEASRLISSFAITSENWNSFLVERLSSLLDEKSLMDWEAHCDDNCEAFLKLSPNNRLDFVKKHQLCINCLRGGHLAKDCRSSLCRTCAKKQHSLLHLPPIASVPSVVEERPSTSTTCTAVYSSDSSFPLAGTSFSGSVAPSVVPSRNSPQANVSSSGSSVVVSSLQSFAVSSFSPSSSVYSKDRSESNEPLPSCSYDTVMSPTLSNKPRDAMVFLSTAMVRVQDADGIGHYARALLDSGSQSNFVSESLCQKLGLKRTFINLPVSGIGQAMVSKTVLGYVVCGKYSTSAIRTVACHVATDQNLNTQLEKMWEIENFDVGKTLNQIEQDVEKHFLQTVSRDTTGRYIVRLPFWESMVPLLGDSYDQAVRRFLFMEKRFARDNDLRDEYVKFMDDYERLGHMEVGSRVAGPQYFLPHHAVHRPESSTTKTRIVFDASSKGSSALSLNDILHTGPTVQPPLLSSVFNFRMPQYVFNADAEKMFRQMWVHPEDRRYLKIVWRREQSMPLQVYQLKTVTYGLACSPYQAARVLIKLAEDDGHNYPLAADVVILKGLLSRRY
ncbi:uncharacterized protein LOC135716044 [Ochlerotatus camptorhynchus]|uniref:uncharacterized protein LOC135716044 n=1 Tax=Ochlerotatus camptorhynchus TaxID=644619 RepID=UPI0031D2B35F